MAGASVAGHRFDDGYRQLNLVSDIPGAAQLLDPNLVNPWGLRPPDQPLWVSDNGTDKATLYTGAVGGQPASIVPLVVSIPGGARQPGRSSTPPPMTSCCRPAARRCSSSPASTATSAPGTAHRAPPRC